MGTYIARRLLLMIPTLFLITIICFLLVRFIPGDVLEMMLSEMAAVTGLYDQITVDYLRHMLGMDVPIHIQYIRWLGNVLKGDLGTSLWSGKSVTEQIIQRIPVTLELGFFAVLTAIVLALPIGIYSAVRQDTRGDYIGRTIAILFISLPVFWVATVIIVLPSILWGWSPPIVYVPFLDDPVRNILEFILPGVLMGMVLSGTTMRMTRTMMLEVMRQDYIRTAWAKGLTEGIIITRHAAKNALMPIITIIGIQAVILIGTTVVVEQIFALPGIGSLLYYALSKRDYPMISGINLIVASFILVVNLIVDLTYAYMDPRIKYR